MARTIFSHQQRRSTPSPPSSQSAAFERERDGGSVHAIGSICYHHIVRVEGRWFDSTVCHMLETTNSLKKRRRYWTLANDITI
jgi:hypothetical protein